MSCSPYSMVMLINHIVHASCHSISGTHYTTPKERQSLQTVYLTGHFGISRLHDPVAPCACLISLAAFHQDVRLDETPCYSSLFL
jgi:hypothetical protein